MLLYVYIVDDVLPFCQSVSDKIANMTFPTLKEIKDGVLFFDCVVTMNVELPLIALIFKQMINNNNQFKAMILCDDEYFLAKIWKIGMSLLRNTNIVAITEDSKARGHITGAKQINDANLILLNIEEFIRFLKKNRDLSKSLVMF